MSLVWFILAWILVAALAAYLGHVLAILIQRKMCRKYTKSSASGSLLVALKLARSLRMDAEAVYKDMTGGGNNEQLHLG